MRLPNRWNYLVLLLVLWAEAVAARAAPPPGYSDAPPFLQPTAASERQIIDRPVMVARRAPAPELVSPPPAAEPVEAVATLLPDQVAPIDLASAWRLAGVENPQIQIAMQQVAVAVAERQLAAAQILPNINAGTNYYNHTGNLQRSDGSILAVNRSGLYAGAGANAVGSGTVNIPGLQWNLSVSDTIFNYLRSQQLIAQRQFANLATRNDIMLQVTVAYLELLRAEQTRAIAAEIMAEAAEVARLTANYAATGQGMKADADRAATEFRQRQTDLLAAEGDVLTTAARLAQLLNIDPSVRLHPNDGWAVPKTVISEAISLRELIAMALMQRPELGERRAAIQRAILELDAAKMLPFSPNVIVGFSAGTFGGGSNLVTPTFGAFDGRTDFDAIAYWTLRNLAVGNRAMINAADSRLRSTNFEQVAVLNRVRSEVASAHARIQARYAQIAINQRAVQSGKDAFREDLIRIRGREGLPIEVLNSLRLLARARMEYLSAIIDYNRAEFELYVALGQPPANAVVRPAGAPEIPANAKPANP